MSIPSLRPCMCALAYPVGVVLLVKDCRMLNLIMEYLVNISKRRAFWSLNEDILKITILKTNTPYPSRKIRRIRAYTHQRPPKKQAQYVDSSIGAKDMGFGRRIRAIEGTQGFYGVTSPQELRRNQDKRRNKSALVVTTHTENEDVRLMMFPLSLTGEAKAWLDELNKGTIKTWDELRTAFISRFFPPALFDLLLREIRAFSQHVNESLTDAWLHMKEMLRNCHGHNLSKGNIINFFYHVLNEITQEVLNAAAGGILLYKTPNQAYQLLEDKYKELQSRAKQPTLDLDNDDIPMSREEEAKFMQTFCKTRF
ncbi:reverse transcriptase domain-containing protein [Tanacetum coccineum]|uniref:Reverse transcriptase domain-containing protein n=1 Tax=Tanacetum coccineum TaxID=301880 RepID=A0ABQ4X903_9ASTR